MEKIAALRYAQALFLLAKETGHVDELYEEALNLRGNLTEEGEFMRTLLHPQISPAEKVAMLDQLLGGRVLSEGVSLMIGFFKLALHKGRAAELPAMMEAFIQKVRDDKGITTARVITAVALSDGQLANIRRNLEAGLNKTVEMEPAIDATLLGGLCVMVDGYIIDTSIKRQIKEMKRKLHHAKLAH